MDGVVIILALILNPLAERRRRRQGDADDEAQISPAEDMGIIQRDLENAPSLVATRVPSRTSPEIDGVDEKSREDAQLDQKQER